MPSRLCTVTKIDDVANKRRGRKVSKTEEERREYQRQKKAKQRTDCNKREGELKKQRDKRAQNAVAEGREPGVNGRPRK